MPGRVPKPPKLPSAPTIAIRPAEGEPIEIPSSHEIQRLAMKWTYVVRNRGRWTTDEEARNALGERAADDLARMGVTDKQLDRLAAAGLIEVGSVYKTEELGWETRVFPWEHLLHFATRSRRQGTSLLVVRHLQRQAKRPPRDDSAAPLFVESAPGPFAELYWFESERYAVLSPFGVNIASHDPSLRNPTKEALGSEIKKLAPAFIHLAGVDAHQGAQILGEPPGEHCKDGYYLSDVSHQPALLEAEDLAKLLTSAKQPPRLVTTNFYDSGPRIASLAVAHGAGAAIGFQDTIDDTLAELFYSILYQALAPAAGEGGLTPGELVEAFAGTFQQVRGHTQSLRGAGIVLWSAESVAGTPEGVSVARELTGSRQRGFERIRQKLDETRGAPSTGTAGDEISVHVVPNLEINYSLLHNRRNLFQTFELAPRRLGKVGGVEVEVELHVHGMVFPFRGVFELDKEAPRGSSEHPDINDQIRVPLTWSMLDHTHESVQTTLYVQVRQNGRTLLRRTYPVTLLPPSEWKDNKTDGLWLPSFVLPRDPAVQRVLDCAVRYLRVLSDNPAAGFSGYAQGGAYVDLQVQAIWSALKHDFGLTYITPPPAYAPSSQRLRSPGEVLEHRRGTCIDLALLLAACLEFVDVYPVVFLLTGHALPGYWRGWDLHASFSIPETPDMPLAANVRPENPGGDADTASWIAGRRAHAEILTRINREEIVPLEATYLTQAKSYKNAREDGLTRLTPEASFDTMLDIRRARTDPRCPVTPLPLKNLIPTIR